MDSDTTKTSPVASTRVVALLRLAVAAAVGAAIIATSVDAASRTTINWFNLFGYFTIQSNIIVAAVYVIGAIRLLRNGALSDQELLARGAATTYITVVGIVYAVLLAPLGAAGGVPVAWANVVLHIVMPIYGVLDWLLFSDRRRIGFRLLWVVPVYPLVWVLVVIVRGATDGWFPYPFLDPATGYGSILTYVAVITVCMLVIGALVFAGTRVRAIIQLRQPDKAIAAG